jgi:hypothetical protein
MQKQTFKLAGLLRAAVVLSIIGFMPVAHAQLVVGLDVSPDQDKLVVTTRGACAKQPNPPGCLRVSGQVQINFNLKNASCDGGQSWALDYVALGNSNKGQPGSISSTAASDFNANQSSGVVTPVSKSAKHILIRDNNSAAYDIWYTVFASCGGSTIKSDPRVENDGSGHN